MAASLFAVPVRPTPRIDRRPGRYTWFVGNLLTGKISYSMPALSPAWSIVMDDAGDLSCTLPLLDPEIASLNPYLTAAPAKAFLAISYTDSQGTERFLQGGPIWTHAYDDATRQLQIGAGGMWSYFDHRKVVPVLAAGVSPSKNPTTFSALSLGTIAARLVALAQSHTGGNVPVVLPADQAGINTRTYEGYELSVVGDMLRDLTKVDAGPEIQFVPRRSSTDPSYLVWDMRVGTTENPFLTQSGDDWVWDASAPQTSVSGISVNRDGTKLGERAWVRGAGDAESTLFGRADSPTLLGAGYPLTEVDDSRDTVELQTTVNAYAAALLARSGQPVETWTMSVRRDEIPTVGTYSVGDWAQLRTGAQHPYLPAGKYRTRITQISGTGDPSVDLQLQPTIAGGLVIGDGGSS